MNQSSSTISKRLRKRVKRFHVYAGDRLIPLRSGTNNPYNRFHYNTIVNSGGTQVDLLDQCSEDFFQREYIRRLRGIWALPNIGDRVFIFSGRPEVGARNKMTRHWLVVPRRRPMTPAPREALDLPHFKGDFYYNQMDWGPTDCVAAWLTGGVHIWNSCDGISQKLCTFEPGCFCSAVRFDMTGESLAVGTNKSLVDFWSVKHSKLYDSIGCYCETTSEGCSINSLEWHPTKTLLVSGCSNGYLCAINTFPQATRYEVYRVQDGQIALVRSSPSGTHLALCGETSIVVMTWDDRSLGFLLQIAMDFPARALAWHPWHSNLLAVGLDFGIAVYNAVNGTQIATWMSSVPCVIDALSFSRRSGELVVSIWLLEEPDASRRRLLVLSSLNHVTDWLLRGREDLGRTISMMWSGDGMYLAIATSEESLMIWNFSGDRTLSGRRIPKNKARSIFQNLSDSCSHLSAIR